jgi:hypothetical protein
VSEEEETGLVVRIVPPLRVVAEGIVGVGNQGIPPGVVGGGGEDVLAPIQPLDHDYSMSKLNRLIIGKYIYSFFLHILNFYANI